MRGKKVVNRNQAIPNTHIRIEINRPHLKKGSEEVRSLEHRFKLQPPTQTQRIINLPSQNNINDYQFQSRQPRTHHNTLNFANLRPNIDVQTINQFNRITEQPKPSNSNHANLQQDRSMLGSSKKIKLVSGGSSRQKSLTSSNNSQKKRGIELTRTLLKRISGMYTDKDFLKRTPSLNKSQKEETTGIMSISGRGVSEEYQISDFDFQVPNHTINISHTNSLSFNDSGNWNQSIQLKKSNVLNNCSVEIQQLQPQYIENNNQYSLINQSKQRVLMKNPQKQLMKVRSFDFINTVRTANSIMVGKQPPPRAALMRRGQGSGLQSERYLILSKNKTMEQMSLKQSKVDGHDYLYYQ